jgi:hypothetical protein
MRERVPSATNRLLHSLLNHVYSAVLVSREERNGLIESIFTGYKFVPKDELEKDAMLNGVK